MDELTEAVLPDRLQQGWTPLLGEFAVEDTYWSPHWLPAGSSREFYIGLFKNVFAFVVLD